MTILSIALIALILSAWHDLKRFPDVNRTINDLKEEVASLKHDNEKLLKDVDRLEMQFFELSNQIDRMKDPELYSLLDAGDGLGIYELQKSRGEI